METIERMSQLLRDKRKLCLLYEKETEVLASQDMEAMEGIGQALERREQLIQEINAIDAQLMDLRDTKAHGAALYQIAKNKCDYETLSAAEKQLFEEGQEIYTVLSRVQETEKKVQKEMEAVMESLLVKIRQNNTSTRFNGYLKQMDYGAAKGLLYDEKR